MIAIACLKVASQAIAAMPMILFSPIIPLIMNVVFMAWAVLVATLHTPLRKIDSKAPDFTARLEHQRYHGAAIAGLPVPPL